MIVGPYDDTGRFGYWVQRIADGGEVLAPEPTDQPVQVIDVRDLADWILLAANARVTGAFNAAGAPGTHTMGSMLADIARVTSSDAHLTWVDDEFLIEQRIEPWSDLPLWLPPAMMPSHAGFMTRDTSAARDRGLTTRALTDTIEATRTWLACADRPGGKDYGNASTRAGLDAARERDLLTAWHDR